jgi:WD40 repeat protein
LIIVHITYINCQKRLRNHQAQKPAQKPAQPAIIPSIEDIDDSHVDASVPPAQTTSVAEFDPEPEGRNPVGRPRRDKYANAGRQKQDAGQKRRVKQASPVSPLRLRARVKAKQWQSGRVVDDENGTGSGPRVSGNKWFRLSSRPYLPWSQREGVLEPVHMLHLEDSELREPSTIHVDFSEDEVRFVQTVARRFWGSKTHQGERSNLDDLRHLVKRAKKHRFYQQLLDAHSDGYSSFDDPPPALLSRSITDLNNFADDICRRNLRPSPHQTFTISRDDLSNRVTRINRAPSLLFAREIVGNRAFSATRRYANFTTTFKSNYEDALEPQTEWTNCAGDIMTLSWVSDTQFICGTTTHSDSHNQQYNKPGNLLLGSSSQKTLRAFPDHRIPRPVVSHGDNALDAMVESQDPWLFSSVVDSDFDPVRKLAFTASFDRTVKIWRVEDTMESIGTWEHGGRVNFVLASKHPHGLVATAADVATGAVRVYHTAAIHLNQKFDSYSCTRIDEEDYIPSEKWAYCPAAIRWALAPDLQHFLLVGYSPRSMTGDDHDIPQDKLSTGELCLWDTLQRQQIKINSLATQNVFEVAWHPSRNAFAVATSQAMSIERNDHNIHTQIRIFEPSRDTGQYTAIKTLDCTAIDINELVIRPNSLAYSYVAAGCTDGNVYIWDTAGSDLPMCTLRHGEPVEELLGEKELEDVGVKFVSWGTTVDRLYTGSSDGVVKVWNIRNRKAKHLRDLIEVSGPITAGAFSPDYTKLTVGDGSGRVYLLSLEDDEDEEETQAAKKTSSDLFRMQLEGKQRAIRRPRPFIPHPEVPPPDGLAGPDPSLGRQRAGEYLQRGEIVLNPHPCIGAVQGPRYAETRLYRAEAHMDDDIGKPLLAGFESQQQENTRFTDHERPRRIRPIKGYESETASRLLHQNTWAEIDHGRNLDDRTRAQLEAEGVECDSDYDFDYESS